jgi:hypothetical protein
MRSRRRRPQKDDLFDGPFRQRRASCGIRLAQQRQNEDRVKKGDKANAGGPARKSFVSRS